MRRLLFLILLCTLAASPRPARADTSDVFGRSQQSEAALIGVMYDLKQTPAHANSGVSATIYCDIFDEFLVKHWDEAVLNRYYRVSTPLYTTQIFIPNMNAGLAPKAFGAEKTVQPSLWLIHYKGQVSPPSPGTYRFWGCADDALAVSVNGKTELVNCRSDMPIPRNGWKQTDPDGGQAADDFLRPGDWFTMKAHDIIDLDVIIGERPGGLFNAFLMIEKQGETYQKDSGGHPILPLPGGAVRHPGGGRPERAAEVRQERSALEKLPVRRPYCRHFQMTPDRENLGA